jgi:hypothetical protein
METFYNTTGEPTMDELYTHWSHFNFTSEQWREAAERFLLLAEAIKRTEADDEEVDHDALGDRFESCDICEHLSELQNSYEAFANEFAPIWAKKAKGE